jgi:hypothetical protein
MLVIANQSKFKCPLCGGSITLPRQSGLGAYINERSYSASDSWPIQWLCILHAQVCKCSSDRIECIEFEEQPPVEFPAAIWEIEHPCSGDSCNAGLCGYTWWDLSETCRGNLVDRIVTAKPEALCPAGHPIHWQKGKVKQLCCLSSLPVQAWVAGGPSLGMTERFSV